MNTSLYDTEHQAKENLEKEFQKLILRQPKAVKNQIFFEKIPFFPFNQHWTFLR